MPVTRALGHSEKCTSANPQLAPSYFSQYFLVQLRRAEENNEDACAAIRTLYIDRDPTTFKDICLHLQGYHVSPRDGEHFVRLFADAQFYTLPKLMAQLYEESIFMSIGHREFKIPRDLFSGPGDSPNFFTLGFAMFFSSPDEIFPGLERNNLIRPPSITPPAVAGRSEEVFAELLHLLRGYPLRIRDEEHRASLLRDCRYFNFKGLEQRIIAHHISYNQARQRSEIVLQIEDLLKSGISIATEPLPMYGGDAISGWVNYARPWVDDSPYELILEIGGESSKIHLNAMRVEFIGKMKARIAKLFEVIAAKLNLPPTTQPLGLLMAKGGASSQPPTPGHTPLSEDLVRIVIESDTYIELDGKVYPTHTDNEEIPVPYSANSTGSNGFGSPLSSISGPTRKRRRLDVTPGQGADEWVIRKGQWRLKIQGQRGGRNAVECMLVAVRLEAYSNEQARNAQRGFLT